MFVIDTLQNAFSFPNTIKKILYVLYRSINKNQFNECKTEMCLI